MKLEEQVVSLELAKELKKLKIEQESLFDWVEIDDNDWMLMGRKKKEFDLMDEEAKESCISAFTVAELGEIMKDKGFECIYFEENKQWGCYLTLDGNEPNYSDTEADARAKMLIYLKKNNLI